MDKMLKRPIFRIVLFLFLAVISLELYTRWPSNATIDPLGIPKSTKYLVLSFHGSNGKDEPLLREATTKINSLLSDSPDTFVKHVVWSPWSDNRLRARVHGRELAVSIGDQLADLPQLRHIRLIAHSAGAYMLDPICVVYKNKLSGTEHFFYKIFPHLKNVTMATKSIMPAHIELTFLDGMGIDGAVDYFYGYRHYGECGDFSKGIISMDPVPGTNAPLEQSYTIDVTDSDLRTETPSHLWPIEYFLLTMTPDEVIPGFRTHEKQSRGSVALE
ncbi:MAG: hypothetical protein VYA80_07585 [Pseudomonadota bacterium]|nr:hypothetical protein [Pseudomonadota bacterium]